MGGGGIGNARILRPYDLKDSPQRNLDDAVVDGILGLAAADFADRLPSSRLANREVSRLLLDNFVVGGQSAFDYYLGRRRASVQEDNTFDRSMRGDYAVPTLFNGNFDAIAFNAGSAQTIPGWSLSQASLVDWREIGGLMNRWDGQSNYLEKLGIDPFSPNYQPNYALQLNSGESVSRDRFVVPDWGALRFDLHVPNLGSGELRVTLQESGDGSGGISTTINLEAALGTDTQYLQDTRRIGYGMQGFETFTLDIPDNLRGKVVTLKFELEKGGMVYLDNVFFKSQHLSLGNPTEAKTPDNTALDGYMNNYLLEKPQYSVSYNRDLNTPNWISWQLNQSWLGDWTSRPPFFSDPTLPTNWYSATDDDYNNDIIIPGTRNPANGEPFRLAPGHMAAFADRSRSRKDTTATNATTNILPQHQLNNYPVWEGLEAFSRRLVNERNKELYIIAGGYGTKPGKEVVTSTDGTHQINVPEYLWKVIAVLDIGQSIADISPSTPVIAVVGENDILRYSDGTPVQGDDTTYPRWYEGQMEIVSVRELENRLNADGTNQFYGLSYNFFSHLRQDIQDAIESRRFTWVGNNPINAFPPVSSLMAESPIGGTFSNTMVISEGAIRHERIAKNSFTDINSTQVNVSQVGILQSSFSHISSNQISPSQVSPSQVSTLQIGISQDSIDQTSTSKGSTNHLTSHQISIGQNSLFTVGFGQDSFSKIGPTQVGIHESTIRNPSTLEISIAQVRSLEINKQVGATEINSSQVKSNKLTTDNPYSTKIPFSSDITLQQLFSSHHFNLQNTTVPVWTSFLQEQTPFNLNIEIKDLPTGQLAEARITSYNSSDRPNSGTLTLDIDGNGLGWFIDSTPWDNTEFSSQPATTTYRATPGSPAFGRYDLLTTILHELGHLQGLIAGNPAYDAHVRSPNNIPTFIGNNFSIPLTVDRSHTAIPTDLMSPYLSPGMRKLPSWENLQMLQAIRAWSGGEMGGWGDGEKPLSAFQKTTPLIGITNGEFDRLEQWDSRGAVQLLNAQATLTERSPLLSNLSQTFLIPEGAKALQFTLVDADLDPSLLAPGDAFEVALLDAATLTPLINPANGLSHTDAFFNLQHSGQTFLGRGVNITQNVDRTRTVTLDLTGIPAHTLATLSFDLLGFGTKEGSVTLDRVRILNDLAPVANPDSATLS